MGKVMLMTECKVDGCSGRIFGHGYCGKHYQRLRTHGHLEQTRPGSWGTRRRDPLYQTWQNIERRVGGAAPEWNLFENFLRDVVARPSPDHKLFTIRPNEPMGPENFRWVLAGKGMERPRRPSDTCKVEGCKNSPHALDLCHKHHARWLRADTLDDPVPRKKDHSKLRASRAVARVRKYGLTLDQYRKMVDDQGGGCAICGGQSQPGKPLSVDHCHKTNVVRGALCVRCNTGIGMFLDDETIIENALVYLRQNRVKVAS